MKYKIQGEPMPVVIFELDNGESIISEAGSMSWMSDNVRMDTKAGKIGKVFGRMFSGEKIFQNIYTADSDHAKIAFASKFVGQIKAIEVTPDKPVICQKSSFLASTEGIEMSVFFQKNIGAGFFGGEGFIMQKMSGHGYVFVEIDGSAVDYELRSGERMVIDTGFLATCDETVSIDVQFVKGVKNVLFGGEGLFNTIVTGPGKITVQTMPLNRFMKLVEANIDVNKSDNNGGIKFFK